MKRMKVVQLIINNHTIKGNTEAMFTNLAKIKVTVEIHKCHVLPSNCLQLKPNNTVQSSSRVECVHESTNEDSKFGQLTQSTSTNEIQEFFAGICFFLSTKIQSTLHVSLCWNNYNKKSISKTNTIQ